MFEPITTTTIRDFLYHRRGALEPNSRLSYTFAPVCLALTPKPAAYVAYLGMLSEKITLKVTSKSNVLERAAHPVLSSFPPALVLNETHTFAPAARLFFVSHFPQS